MMYMWASHFFARVHIVFSLQKWRIAEWGKFFSTLQSGFQWEKTEVYLQFQDDLQQSQIVEMK